MTYMATRKIPKIAAFAVMLSIFFIWGFLTIHNANAQTPPPQNVKLDVILHNPIQANDFQEFLAKVLHIAFLIGIPITALMIIWAGFLFVTAAGNETKLKTAKETFLWTVVGAAILLGAEVISNALIETVKKL